MLYFTCRNIPLSTFIFIRKPNPKVDVLLFRDRAGEWDGMFAVTLNTTSREEKEIAQLEHGLSFALVRMKSECALSLNNTCSLDIVLQSKN